MSDPTRFDLDDRQRAMLAEMGVRVWWPQRTAEAQPQGQAVAARAELCRLARTLAEAGDAEMRALHDRHSARSLEQLRQEVEAGLLWASEIVDPPLERVLTICWSRHIPVSSASQAVMRLTRALVAQLEALKASYAQEVRRLRELDMQVQAIQARVSLMPTGVSCTSST